MTTRKNIVRGFTLVEALVAIGAIAIISVGLASIFGSVGETVTRGRRVAAINEMAKRIEEQIRSDIDRMTRDGFLVIRNQAAAPQPSPQGLRGRADQVFLAKEDPYPRPYRAGGLAGNLPITEQDHRHRRVDELMFFTKGDFASARVPVDPDLSATSNAARIYYGHGMRLGPNPPRSSWEQRYTTPELNDAFDEDNMAPPPRLAFGTRTVRGNPSQMTGLGFNGPNEFASEWSLQRQVTLLAEPKTSPPFDAGGNPVQLNQRSFSQSFDSRYQIGGQPAVPTVFQSLSNYYPSQTVAGVAYPSMAPPTGSVLRRDILVPPISGTRAAGPVFASGIMDISTTSFSAIRKTILGSVVDPLTAYAGGAFGDLDLFEGTIASSFVPGSPLLMQYWMVDAFPGNALGYDQFNEVDMFLYSTRMRYEPEPTNLTNLIAEDPRSGDTTEREIRIADQLMLSSSVFLPRCTEFIVEWSFGETVPPGQVREGEIIWHGLTRFGDWDGDGIVRDRTDETVVDPYPFYRVALGNTSYATRPHSLNYTLRDGTPATNIVDPSLIHPEIALSGGSIQLTSCFGYIDPTYVPANDNDPASIDWAWPKLIRITVSIADEEDPNLERTFQFVFEVPDDRAG